MAATCLYCGGRRHWPGSRGRRTWSGSPAQVSRFVSPRHAPRRAPGTAAAVCLYCYCWPSRSRVSCRRSPRVCELPAQTRACAPQPLMSSIACRGAQKYIAGAVGGQGAPRGGEFRVLCFAHHMGVFWSWPACTIHWRHRGTKAAQSPIRPPRSLALGGFLQERPPARAASAPARRPCTQRAFALSRAPRVRQYQAVPSRLCLLLCVHWGGV